MAMLNKVFFTAIIFGLLVAGAFYYKMNFDQSPCNALKAISKNTIENERLRIELNEFINDESNLNKFQETGYKGDSVRNELAFAKSFQWQKIFSNYEFFETRLDDLKLVLRIEGDSTEKAKPPYRISEAGVYGARTLIMYKNEDEAQYTGGKGVVALSPNSYVVCNVSFEDGSPFE